MSPACLIGMATASAISTLSGLVLGALLAVGCAPKTNAFPALTTTGELADDGAGECGAVAISATRAITSAHCVRGAGSVYYHAPGEAEGRRVGRVWIDEKSGGACLEVETNTPPSEVMTAEQNEAIVLESNLSGVVHGNVRERNHAEVASRQGDSGSALRSLVSGAVIGVMWGGMTPGAAQDTSVVFTHAEKAVALCGE